MDGKIKEEIAGFIDFGFVCEVNQVEVSFSGFTPLLAAAKRQENA
jgi:hypothetical protein